MAERLEEILREYDASLATDSIRIGDLSSGFELPEFNLTLYTEGDIFGDIANEAGTRNFKSQTTNRKSKLGAFISDFRDLKTDDYVVHVDHGISRFDGLQTISSQGAEREFMLLIYADNAKLFVPVERMDLVSRYSSGEATSPTLDRLGGIGWQKTKAGRIFDETITRNHFRGRCCPGNSGLRRPRPRSGGRRRQRFRRRACPWSTWRAG